jgi:hypothetical protein
VSAATPTAVTTCGTTLTGAGYLPGDLSCTGGDGVILAGDATLDLRGRRLIGPGSGVGVRLSPSGKSRIVNGTIRGWGTAVSSDEDFETPLDATLTGLNAYGGVVLAKHVTAADNTGSGIQGDFGADLTVADSVLRNNKETGLGTYGPLHASRLVIVGSQRGVSCFESTCDVSRSLIADNETGVSGFASRGTYAGNTFVRNRTAFSTGYSNAPSTLRYDEEVRDNRFLDNDVAVTIGAIASTAYRRNTFSRNGVGFQDDGEWQDSFVVLLERNTLTRNGDGINLRPMFRTAQLSGNRAVRNTGWGIHVPDAVDLGGNSASGNGNEPQCVGVVC